MKEFLSLLVAFSLSAAAADLAPTGTLRAVFLGGNPVQATVDAKTGAVSGPVADIVKELARRAGVPYTITPVTRGGREIVERLNDQTADIGFLAWESERARQMDFSRGYLLMGASYLVAAASPIKTAADADRAGVKIGAVAEQSPTIFLKEHLKNAKLTTWPAAPSFPDLTKMFASGEVDAFAGNRTRLIEAAEQFPGLRVAQDNFTDLEQNIVVRKGDAVKLKILNDFLADAAKSGFVKNSIQRAGLKGVEAAK